MGKAPNRLENLQSLKVANVDVAFATAFGTLVTGAFLVGFVKSVGGSDIWIGLLTAVPSLLGILQIPGAIIGRGFPSFKPYVLAGGLLWRIFYIPLILLPLLPLPPLVKLWALGACVAVASASVLMVNPIYNDWLAELVPASSRGWYFSRRNAIATAAGAAVGMLGALVLDAFRKSNQEQIGFSVIFGIGIVCAFLSMAIFVRMKDIPRPNPIRLSLREGSSAFLLPFKDREFRRVLVFFIVFIGGQAFAGNLFSAFALESLGLPFTIIQLAVVMHAVGNLISARFWGFLADKYGNKPILMLAGVGLTLTPIMWLFCQPGQDLRNSIILVSGHIFTGAIWSGIALCQFNLLLATAPHEDRANYLGAGMALQAIVGGIAPLLGATLMTGMREVVDPSNAYKVVFLATMGLRLVSVFFLIPVKEEGSRGLVTALQHLRRTTPRGLRAMRNLSRSADFSSRADAIESVGNENFALAADEIVKALHDPAPKVRRQAALALARLRDATAVHALVHQIEEHPDLVEEETVEALGELGDPVAVPSLIRLLESPRSLLRRAAAKAIGRLGSQEAIPPLMDAAAEPGDPDLRRASLQALRVLGATEAQAVISDALFDAHPSVRIAAAEAVSELELHSAEPNLRQSLQYYDDEAASEVAYALGTVGTMESIPIILKEASESVSMITRRRCLLGVARLLGVERESYRLFLLEGMARDSALLEMLTPAMRADSRLRPILSQYSAGDEAAALKSVASATKLPHFAMIAEQPVDELFLVVAAALAKAT